MKWVAIAVLYWTSAVGGQPTVIQVPVENELLCKQAVETLARTLGGNAAADQSRAVHTVYGNGVLTACVRVAE